MKSVLKLTFPILPSVIKVISLNFTVILTDNIASTKASHAKLNSNNHIPSTETFITDFTQTKMNKQNVKYQLHQKRPLLMQSLLNQSLLTV